MGAGDDPYAAVAKGKLKLKGDSGVKKKKKKDKKILEQVTKTIETQETESPSKQTKTKAELAFLQQQEKMKMKRILEKASQTHKERVEKFNQHLDSLTEHFDIPKVSWTK
ncbi:protein FAM32A [Anoplophora glabripennis]|uniref:Protein FAM32A n=1 Tax=Anoplophora glabripennis TaxID=217634 RepID=V5GRA3_ANOGL|nr:protein FAM32A [Anoplophora glabripennis]